MPQDRSIAVQIRETLGEKTVKKFFADPADPKNPVGNEARWAEFVDRSLWWLADHARVEITDSTSFILPEGGLISLDSGPGARIKKIIRVQQDGRFFEEVTTDWSEGMPRAAGHWLVRNRTFYVAGYGPLPREDRLYGYDPHLLLHPGPITFVYWGVPTEQQLTDSGNQKLIRACVDYGLYLAFTDMIGRILRPKNIELDGVPKIKHNAKDYREEANQRLKMAMESLGHVDGLTLGSANITPAG